MKKDDFIVSVTRSIIADLNIGVRPWMKPWNAGHADGRVTLPLRHDGTPYQGMNIVNLWATGIENEFASPYWITFKQALELGGSVRKGQKSLVRSCKFGFTKKENSKGEEVDVPFNRVYAVFNADQCDGLPERFSSSPEPILSDIERNARLDAFFAGIDADIRHGGNRAFYTPTHDYIQLPHFEFFLDVPSYYATLSHESIHWTRHSSRLNRDFGRKKWGDEGYAMEELVAELGSAFLCAYLQITPEVREDHASYIAGWLSVLNRDQRAIFTAASAASKALTYLQGLQSTAAVPVADAA